MMLACTECAQTLSRLLATYDRRFRRRARFTVAKAFVIHLLFFLLFSLAHAQTNPFAVGNQGNGATGNGNGNGTPNGNGGAANAGAAGGGHNAAANAIGGPAVTANGSAPASPTSMAIPSSAAAGGITITQPQQTAAQSYYKIAQGVSVTFGWNFTSVLRYPSSLVVQAYCSENSNTYTLASSLAGTATAFTWAPYEYDQTAAMSGQPQLIQATYRLQIMDERGLSVGAQAGLFQPNTKVEFALYQPKPYTPIAEGWTCAGCNGATRIGRPTLLTLVVVTAVALLTSIASMCE